LTTCTCIELHALCYTQVTPAAQNYVIATMGETFVTPPVFDLTVCFEESNCATPLIFILSPGSDPMGAVLKAAEVSFKRHIHTALALLQLATY
jgi:dynein heavy chain, axonemal